MRYLTLTPVADILTLQFLHKIQLDEVQPSFFLAITNLPIDKTVKIEFCKIDLQPNL